MQQILRLVLFGSLMVVTTAPAGSEFDCSAKAPLATSFRLDYLVTATRSFLSLSGDGTIVYRRKGDAYTMESSLQALGIFEAHQSSAGTVRAEGLVPRSFSQRTSRRPPRSVSIDWPAQRVSFSQNGESEPTRPQLQDRLSLLLQLAWRHRAEPGARGFELPVAGLTHVSAYVFNAAGAETVTVPAGRYETVKFERHKEGGDDALDVWIAPALCSLPVRVRFTDDKGLIIEQQLRAIEAL
jgi:hypothetical protein